MVSNAPVAQEQLWLAVAALGLERNRTAWVRGANSSCLSLTPTDWTSGGRSSPPLAVCAFFPYWLGENSFPDRPLEGEFCYDGSGAAFALGGIRPNCFWISGRAPAAPGRDIGPSGRTSTTVTTGTEPALPGLRPPVQALESNQFPEFLTGLARVRIVMGSHSAPLRSSHTCGVVSVPHSLHSCFGLAICPVVLGCA